MAVRPNQAVNYTSPPSPEVLCKVVQIKITDTTAFDAFILPKGAVVAGAYVIGSVNSDSATSAIIDVGTNPGTADEIVDSYNIKTGGDGYYTVGAAGGSAMGAQLTADTLYKAKYTEVGTATTGGPWLVKVEYYMPQQGMTW